jgi:hypothetical protein
MEISEIIKAIEEGNVEVRMLEDAWLLVMAPTYADYVEWKMESRRDRVGEIVGKI